MNGPEVQVSIEDGYAAYDLFSYVGDHGGGERYPNGDCPDQREAPCPSCDANRLATVFKRALDATDDPLAFGVGSGLSTPPGSNDAA